jgi:hypothetical protein
MVAIDYAIQTSNRTMHRLALAENWTRHVQLPSTVRIIGDEIITGLGDYESAIEKTIYAIDTFDAEYEWLHIMDDDGYAVPHRMEKRLRDCNPDEHHAIGCVHGKLSTKTHKFPALHGGCGMALSRATVCALQQRLWAEEFYRHERHSDATISYNLHYLGIVPTHDERFTQDANTTDGWIACHQPKESDYLRLNEAQQEGNQIKGIFKGVSQNAVKGFV